MFRHFGKKSWLAQITLLNGRAPNDPLFWAQETHSKKQ
jgi:hypothetical protein